MVSPELTAIYSLPHFPEFAQAVRYGVPRTPASRSVVASGWIHDSLCDHVLMFPALCITRTLGRGVGGDSQKSRISGGYLCPDQFAMRGAPPDRPCPSH